MCVCVSAKGRREKIKNQKPLLLLRFSLATFHPKGSHSVAHFPQVNCIKSNTLTAQPRDVLLNHQQQQRRDAQQHDLVRHRVERGEEPDLVPVDQVGAELVRGLFLLSISGCRVRKRKKERKSAEEEGKKKKVEVEEKIKGASRRAREREKEREQMQISTTHPLEAAGDDEEEGHDPREHQHGRLEDRGLVHAAARHLEEKAEEKDAGRGEEKGSEERENLFLRLIEEESVRGRRVPSRRRTNHRLLLSSSCPRIHTKKKAKEGKAAIYLSLASFPQLQTRKCASPSWSSHSAFRRSRAWYVGPPSLAR